MANKELKSVFNALDALLNMTDLSDVTADSNNFSELPDGYYLCEVEKAELKESKSSHQPMAAFQLKIIEDGVSVDTSGELVKCNKTKNRKIFLYYV